jgi:ABC-type dipeptide/oligopeptide/nickel transport system permease component
MTVLPFVLSRVLWGAFSYLLAVAGFLALLSGTLEATARGMIAEAVNNAMYSIKVKDLDAEGVRAIREELRSGLEQSLGLDRPFLARVADRYIGLLRLDLGTSRTMRTAGPLGLNVSSISWPRRCPRRWCSSSPRPP